MYWHLNSSWCVAKLMWYRTDHQLVGRSTFNVQHLFSRKLELELSLAIEKWEPCEHLVASAGQVMIRWRVGKMECQWYCCRGNKRRNSSVRTLAEFVAVVGSVRERSAAQSLGPFVRFWMQREIHRRMLRNLPLPFFVSNPLPFTKRSLPKEFEVYAILGWARKIDEELVAGMTLGGIRSDADVAVDASSGSESFESAWARGVLWLLRQAVDRMTIEDGLYSHLPRDTDEKLKYSQSSPLLSRLAVAITMSVWVDISNFQEWRLTVNHPCRAVFIFIVNFWSSRRGVQSTIVMYPYCSIMMYNKFSWCVSHFREIIDLRNKHETRNPSK